MGRGPRGEAATHHPGNLRQPASLGGSARSRRGPARSLPAKRMPRGGWRGGDRRAAACTQPGHTRWGRARRRHHHSEGSLVAFGVLEPQGEPKGKRRGQKSNLRAEITKPSESVRSSGPGVRPQELPWERKEGRRFPSEVRRQGLHEVLEVPGERNERARAWRQPQEPILVPGPE